MASASDYLESALLEHLRGTQLPLPSAFYFALHTADPTDAGIASTEASVGDAYGGYVRKSMGAPSAAWSAITTDTDGKPAIKNAAELRFAKNTGETVTLTHWSVWDAASNGNMWLHAPITRLDTGAAYSITLNTTDSAVLDAGQVVVKIGGVISGGFRTALFNHLKGTRLALPAGLYVGLDGGDATQNGDLVTEFSTADWPAYQRRSVGSPLSSAWTAAANEAGGGKQIANANLISFPANDGSASLSVTSFSLWDADSAGNMLLRAALSSAKTLNVNNTLDFEPGTLRPISR
jgi:hypothetical protein